jgi:hypothetical protein
MGQVRIEYGNGVIVCVNRHPSKHWIVSDILPNNGWYNYHISGQANPVVDNSGLSSYDLPPGNGWVCYSAINPNLKSTFDKSK